MSIIHCRISPTLRNTKNSNAECDERLRERLVIVMDLSGDSSASGVTTDDGQYLAGDVTRTLC